MTYRLVKALILALENQVDVQAFVACGGPATQVFAPPPPQPIANHGSTHLPRNCPPTADFKEICHTTIHQEPRRDVNAFTVRSQPKKISPAGQGTKTRFTCHPSSQSGACDPWRVGATKPFCHFWWTCGFENRAFSYADDGWADKCVSSVISPIVVRTTRQ